MKRMISLLIACIMMATLFAGCASQGDSPAVRDDTAAAPQAEAPQAPAQDETAPAADVSDQNGFTILDVNGTEVAFEKQPETFVVANYIFNFLLVGGGESLERVVGLTKDGWEDTRYGEYTALTRAFPQILEIPSIGGYHDDVLDRERILELAPDCLLINNAQYTENETSIPVWEAAGIRVVVLDYHKMSLENDLVSTEVLGKLLGREEIAKELCDHYADGIRLVQDRVATLTEAEKDIKVYMELGNQGVGTIGNSYDGTLWGAIIDNVGAKNIAAGKLPEAYGPLDMEYILEQNPDVIIIGGSIWSGDDGNDQMRMGLTIQEPLAQERLRGFAQRDWFAQLTAVKNGEVYGVDHGSLRNILDYTFTEYIAKILYPDLFADVDPQTEYRGVLAKYLPEVTEPGTFMIHLETAG